MTPEENEAIKILSGLIQNPENGILTRLTKLETKMLFFGVANTSLIGAAFLLVVWLLERSIHP